MEAFASLSRKAAGSQGRALSRPSQRAESPFDFPVPRKGKSTKLSFKAPPAGGKILCAPGALMEGTVLSGRFPLYRHFISSARSYGARMHFVPHRTSSRIGDEVAANQSGRLVCMSGLWPQGCCAAAAALFIFVLVHFRPGENERGSFALCGARPGSTWTGQPARLDRAGPQARTRFRLRAG